MPAISINSINKEEIVQPVKGLKNPGGDAHESVDHGFVARHERLALLGNHDLMFRGLLWSRLPNRGEFVRNGHVDVGGYVVLVESIEVQFIWNERGNNLI